PTSAPPFGPSPVAALRAAVSALRASFPVAAIPSLASFAHLAIITSIGPSLKAVPRICFAASNCYRCPMDAPLLIKNAVAVLPQGMATADVLVVNGVIKQ